MYNSFGKQDYLTVLLLELEKRNLCIYEHMCFQEEDETVMFYIEPPPPPKFATPSGAQWGHPGNCHEQLLFFT